MLIPDTPSAQEYALRQEQARKHTLAVIWQSIMAHAADLAGRPADARDASLDAAAHARAVVELSIHPC